MKNIKFFFYTLKLSVYVLFSFKLKKIEKIERIINKSKIRIYKSKKSFFPVIVLHGVTRKGYDDKKLAAFSMHLAGIGFIAITPELYNLKNLVFDFKDINIINNVIEYSVKKFKSKIGIIGFSFGASFGLISSSVSANKSQIKFILCASPY
jgi:dienelactone hydrolase